MAHQLYAGVRRGEPVKPLKLFLQSNNYLAVVFCALAVDSALDLPTLLYSLSMPIHVSTAITSSAPKAICTSAISSSTTAVSAPSAIIVNSGSLDHQLVIRQNSDTLYSAGGRSTLTPAR